MGSLVKRFAICGLLFTCLKKEIIQNSDKSDICGLITGTLKTSNVLEYKSVFHKALKVLQVCSFTSKVLKST